MIQGLLNCTVECSPLFGSVLLNVIEDIINKKDIPKKIYINDNVFTPESAREALKTREY